MPKPRHTRVIINYEGIDISKDLEPYLADFSYTDNEGKGDDIQIKLQDRDKKWQGPWLPNEGDIITATIQKKHSRKEDEVEQLRCGKFYVDDVSFKGPPDEITIKAMSIPFASSGKGAKHTRSWEEAGLATIAGEVAESSGLSLLYDAPNFIYDRVDQLKETDLSFIKRLAKREGIAVKVTDDQLVLYDENSYEGKSTILTLKRGRDNIISYDFNKTAAEEQYEKVTVSYFDDTKKKTLKYTYKVPGVEEGPVLKVNKRAKNIGEAMRWARAEARDKNKGARTGKLGLEGSIKLVQGVTVTIYNFGAFDGKYFVENSSHKVSVSGGYTTDISLREVLGY